MGDDRKPDYDYEMAPQSEGDVEKGKLESTPEEEKKSVESAGGEWGGLNKAQLLEVADTPFWNWTRNILLILFWIGWVAMLVAAIVIVVKVPRCPEVEWWEKSVFYRVFPQSFKDSNGDGYGDLQGLTKKLDYVKGIGAEVLVLSSIFKQPEVSRDLGQDIVNFTDVDATLGSLEGFKSLMKAAGEQELKVILEFVPNHSSDQHPWFLASVNQTGNFSDYYVWENCTSANPPNDWLNKYGDSAWTYNAVRNQCYYHYLLPEQPDLNYDNPKVVAEMEMALQFWFDEGVDGFVFSGVDYIFETDEVATSLGNRRRRQANDTTALPPNAASTTAPAQTPTQASSVSTEPSSEPEPTVSGGGSGSGGAANGMSAPQYSCVGDGCAMTQKKLHDLLVQFRDVFNTNSYLGKYRLMVAETEQAPEAAVLLYGNESREADLVLYKGFASSIMDTPTAQSIKDAVSTWITAREASFESRWNTWTFGDEDMSRIATRAGDKFASALNVILLTLPGTPISYYGEELGTPDLTNVPTNMDPVANSTNAVSRDPERGPMFWANTTTGNFTFTNSTAWLPVPSDNKYSVEVQDQDDMSVLSAFKELAEIHKEPSITAGSYKVITTAPDTIYAYTRQFPDWPGYLVVANFGDADAKLDFEVKVGDKVITRAELEVKSAGDVEKHENVVLAEYSIKSGEALVFQI